jgi:hypothetical protein
MVIVIFKKVNLIIRIKLKRFLSVKMKKAILPISVMGFKWASCKIGYSSCLLRRTVTYQHSF